MHVTARGTLTRDKFIQGAIPLVEGSRLAVESVAERRLRWGKMLVIVDANIIMKDALLRDRKWGVARDAIAVRRLRLVLPETARLEAIGGYRRDHNEKVRQVRAVIRKSTNKAKLAAEALLQVYADEINEYESILGARLKEIGFEVPHPSIHSHLELTDRAVNRKAPFDDSGGGYRDTLLWLTALEQVDSNPFDDLLVVSDDTIFTKRKSELAAELLAETGAMLTVFRSIANVAFPGEYESGSFDLSDLDLNVQAVTERIRQDLAHEDITRWSPPGVDHAQVRVVDRIDLRPETLDVKKRYGSDVYEISVEAIADIDAEVLVINEAYDDEVDFTQMSARWDLHVRWRGEAESGVTGLDDESKIEVLAVKERKRSGR